MAGLFDLITSFAGFGYIIAKFTGNTCQNGFQLNGLPALVVFALIIVCFFLMPRFAGGTIWQHILPTPRKT